MHHIRSVLCYFSIALFGDSPVILQRPAGACLCGKRWQRHRQFLRHSPLNPLSVIWPTLVDLISIKINPEHPYCTEKLTVHPTILFRLCNSGTWDGWSLSQLSLVIVFAYENDSPKYFQWTEREHCNSHIKNLLTFYCSCYCFSIAVGSHVIITGDLALAGLKP